MLKIPTDMTGYSDSQLDELEQRLKAMLSDLNHPKMREMVRDALNEIEARRESKKHLH